MNIAVCVKQVIDTEARAEARPDLVAARPQRDLHPQPVRRIRGRGSAPDQGGARRRSDRRLHGPREGRRRRAQGPGHGSRQRGPRHRCGAGRHRRAGHGLRAGRSPQDACSGTWCIFGVRSTDGETGCVPARGGRAARRAAALVAGQGRGRRLHPQGAAGDRAGLRRVSNARRRRCSRSSRASTSRATPR